MASETIRSTDVGIIERVYWPCRCSTFNPPRRERPSYGVQRRVRATITKSGAPGRHEPYAELDDGQVMPMGLNGTQVIAVGTVGVAEYVTSPSGGLWRFIPGEEL